MQQAVPAGCSRRLTKENENQILKIKNQNDNSKRKKKRFLQKYKQVVIPACFWQESILFILRSMDSGLKTAGMTSFARASEINSFCIFICHFDFCILIFDLLKVFSGERRVQYGY